jgi:hypothetical protein
VAPRWWTERAPGLALVLWLVEAAVLKAPEPKEALASEPVEQQAAAAGPQEPQHSVRRREAE